MRNMGPKTLRPASEKVNAADPSTTSTKTALLLTANASWKKLAGASSVEVAEGALFASASSEVDGDVLALINRLWSSRSSTWEDASCVIVASSSSSSDGRCTWWLPGRSYLAGMQQSAMSASGAMRKAST